MMTIFFRVLKYEWKKNFGKTSILIIVLIFSMFNLINIYYQYRSNSYFADDNGWKDAYWRVYDCFSGEITSEKLAELKKIYVPLAHKVADMTFNRAVDLDTITGVNEFSDYLLLDSYYVADMERFCEYAKKAEETALRAKANVELYNAVGNVYQARANVKIYNLFQGRRIEKFAYIEGYNRMTEYTFSSWLVLLVCLFATSGIFSGEKEIQMDKFLKTTKNGYYVTAYAKIMVVLLFSLSISLWFSLVDYFGFSCIYGLAEAGSLPVFALPDFAFSALNCKLWQYSLLMFMCRTLGTAFFVLLCSFVSLFFSTTLWPFVLGGVLTGMPCLLVIKTQNLYENYWRVCNPAFLLNAKSIYKRTVFVNVCGEPVAVSLVAFCTSLFLCSILIIWIVHVYCRGGLLIGEQCGGRHADSSL